MERHLRGAEAYINSALRPGTQANHISILRTYIDFACAHNLYYSCPSVSSICAFIHYLTIKYDKSTTIINAISGLASVLRRMGIDTSPFRSINVLDFVLSIKTNIRHVPFKRLPVSFEMLRDVLVSIRPSPEGPTIALALLIMYYTFFRQSNLCPRNKTGFDQTRHLVRGDVIARPHGLAIALKWSKTRQTMSASTTAAPAMADAAMCPVAAHRDMLVFSPTMSDSQPLISFRDASPLPLTFLKKAWDQALGTLGADPHFYTLHSLRRGGATDIYTHGAASIQQIKDHGDWASDAVYQYLPNDPGRSSVVAAFKDF